VQPHLQPPTLLWSLTLSFQASLAWRSSCAALVLAYVYPYEKGFLWVDKYWNFAQQHLIRSLQFLVPGYLFGALTFPSKPLQQSVAPVFLSHLISVHKLHNVNTKRYSSKSPSRRINLHSPLYSPVSHSPSPPLPYPRRHLH
jgi:hypothetical protein